MKKSKLFMLLLVVAAFVATCFTGEITSFAAEKNPVPDQELVKKISVYLNNRSSDLVEVTGTAIQVVPTGIQYPEVTGPAILVPVPVIGPEIPIDPAPQVAPHVSDVETEWLAPDQLIEESEGIELENDEMRHLGIICLNAADYGIIDQVSPLEFQGYKRATYGQFALMIYNAISPEGQMLNTKYARCKAVEWLKVEYGLSYKASKKMTYAVAEKVFSKILEQKGQIWKEGFENLKKETKLNFPSLSLGGDKMSRIEALYTICMLLEPDMPNYYQPDDIQCCTLMW